MNQGCRELADEYLLAVQDYLAEPDEPALARAHELGRKALTDGLGVLDIATAHAHALRAGLSVPLSDADRTSLLDGLEAVFVESLSAFEMTHRGFWEATVALRRFDDMLEGQAKRIASALHDEVGQLFACVHLSLAALAPRLAPDDAADVQTARNLLDDVEKRLRGLAHELRPPILDNLGLVPALEFLTAGVSKRWGLPVSVQVSIDPRLPASVETTLYRITQEALTNVVRHAKATHASVTVHQAAHQVACSIRDDGIGIDTVGIAADTRARGLGLMAIEERVTALGGRLSLGANSPCGTALTVEIPLGP